MSAPKKSASPVSRDLERDIGSAKVLRAHLVEILGEEAADAETIRDAIEGETGLFETLCAVAGQIGEDEAAVEGIRVYISKQASRKSRLEKRSELLRTALMNALDMLQQENHKIDAALIVNAIAIRAMDALADGRLDATVATITLKRTPGKLAIVNEAEVPVQYWTQPDPELDRTALTSALKNHRDTLAQKLAELDGRRKSETMDDATYADLRARIVAAFPAIPGAELGNGGGTVQIRFS